jgi:hypothetical protein
MSILPALFDAFTKSIHQGQTTASLLLAFSSMSEMVATHPDRQTPDTLQAELDLCFRKLEAILLERIPTQSIEENSAVWEFIKKNSK